MFCVCVFDTFCMFRNPDDIYHVCIMPCFDKKLEASREQFYSDVFHTRDVDCVISTLEVELMLEKDNIDLSQLQPAALDSLCVFFVYSEFRIYIHMYIKYTEA